MRLEPLIQGNDEVQKHVASERNKEALVAVSPMARKAIEKEILPQLEVNLTSEDMIQELAETTTEEIRQSFRAKDEIYTRLIQYKSIDQSDNQYLEDLGIVMGEWARKAQSLLEKKEETPGANEIKVKIELDTGDDDKDVVFVEKEDADKKRAPITVEEIFDLGSVRLRG